MVYSVQVRVPPYLPSSIQVSITTGFSGNRSSIGGRPLPARKGESEKAISAPVWRTYSSMLYWPIGSRARSELGAVAAAASPPEADSSLPPAISSSGAAHSTTTASNDIRLIRDPPEFCPPPLIGRCRGNGQRNPGRVR